MPPLLTRVNPWYLRKLTLVREPVINLPMSHLISDTELEVALSGLPGWEVVDDQLVKRFTLLTFREAIAILVRISFEAEDSNHYPAIYNEFNVLEFRLCSHDAGDKLTDKDLKLAAKIEELVEKTKG